MDNLPPRYKPVLWTREGKWVWHPYFNLIEWVPKGQHMKRCQAERKAQLQDKKNNEHGALVAALRREMEKQRAHMT